MPGHERRYAGPRAPVWPLNRPPARLGCSALAWLGLAVGLGLAVFSVSGISSGRDLFADHAQAVWVAVGLLSLTWPALYLWAGWFRTLYGYWPAPGDGEGIGPACETCGSTVRRGHTRYGHYVCDVCARQRALDNRRLIVPLVVMVGVAFLANGLSSLVEVMAMRRGQAAGGLLGRTAAAEWERWQTTLGLMGLVGGFGLVLAGCGMLSRILRRMVLAPIRERAILTVRAQIGAALDREDAGKP